MVSQIVLPLLVGCWPIQHPVHPRHRAQPPSIHRPLQPPQVLLLFLHQKTVHQAISAVSRGKPELLLGPDSGQAANLSLHLLFP